MYSPEWSHLGKLDKPKGPVACLVTACRWSCGLAIASMDRRDRWLNLKLCSDRRDGQADWAQSLKAREPHSQGLAVAILGT